MQGEVPSWFWSRAAMASDEAGAAAGDGEGAAGAEARGVGALAHPVRARRMRLKGSRIAAV
jgi:hypothetical protein